MERGKNLKCPYRARHEYDAEGLCVHCYAARPEEDTETTAPHAVTPSIWGWANMYAPPASPELQKAVQDLIDDLDALPGVGPKDP